MEIVAIQKYETFMRTFERSHPWITFRCDLGRAGADLWLLLGEAASKCEHISRVPLQPTTAKRLHQLYLAKGAAATTAIEGNTLSEEDVLKAVALGAKGTYIGRSMLYGLGAMGEAGVSKALQIIHNELDLTMAFCGRTQIGTVDSSILLPGTFPKV